jgi:hypothetical protein
MYCSYLSTEEKHVMDTLFQKYKIDTMKEIFNQAKIYQYIFHDFNQRYEEYSYVLQLQNPSFLRQFHEKIESMNQKMFELQYEMNHLSYLFLEHSKK